MRTVYLDCAAGISGDMTLAALLDAGIPPQAIRAAINSLGLPGVELDVTQVMRCGFRARYITVQLESLLRPAVEGYLKAVREG